MTSQPIIRVVAAIIERDGTVFVARRNKDRSAGGLWEFPGGKVETGESPEDALRRELQEELSADTSVGAFITRSRTTINGRPLEMSCYAATFTGTDPEYSTDHDAMMWIALDKLSTLDWAPADVPIIKHLPKTIQEIRRAPATSARITNSGHGTSAQ